MYQGSCLCGAVQYELRGEIGKAYYCHCLRCRKASGSAFASNALVNKDDFVVTQGEDKLKSYVYGESGLERKFCGECGSPLVSQRASGRTVLRLGSLDTDLAQGPGAHIFVDSKASWDHITDDLPCFADWPE